MRPETYTVELPLSIQVNKKGKPFYLNLNIYRNAHFHTLNSAKTMFEVVIKEQIKKLPKMKTIELTYHLYTRSLSLVDLGNINSIIDKFFCDTLVNAHVIPDDNITIIKKITHEFIKMDRLNPRVEAIISNIEFEEPEKEEPMRVTLVQSEIEEALRDYVVSRINIPEGQQICIELRAGRGNDGYTADMEFVAGAARSTQEVTGGSSGSVGMTEAQEAFLASENDPEQEEATSDPETEVETESEQIQEQEEVKEEIAAVVKPTVEAPTSPAPVKSLFADLKQPINKKT